MLKEDILLVGGGGHCRSVIDVIEMSGRYNIFGIIDLEENLGKDLFGYKVIGTDKDLRSLLQRVRNAFVTIGDVGSNHNRVRVFYMLRDLGFVLPNIISPYAYVSKHATLGGGNVIMHHALINAGARIGDNCIINSKALVEHDAVIKDHCHIATGAIVNGGVVVESNTFLGSNATSKQHIVLKGFIKAGSVAK